MFSHDFETSFPDYGYSFAYAGQGSPDCSTNFDNNDQVSSTFDTTTGPNGNATLDSSGWVLAPDACYNYLGWGLGLGHILGDSNQVLTSDDLSQYTISFDAWAEGYVLFDLETDFAFSFQGPATDGSGNPATTLTVGVASDPISALYLTDTPQTFTFSLDELAVIGGSIADWQNAPFNETSQLSLQIEPKGTAELIGQDDDNIVHVDNYTLTAPFDIVAPECDFDDNGACDGDDINLLTAETAAGTNNPDFDLTQDGLVDIDDIDEWRSLAGEENLGEGQSYLIGDATLDGVTDGLDFIEWNENKFSSNTDWTGGNFNGDAVTDGLDFIEWNDNKFMSSGVAAVPEPACGIFWIWGAAAGLSLSRRS